MTDQLSGILESKEPKLLATGFEFTDGPLWHPEGCWEFADIPARRIHWLPPGGTVGLTQEHSGGSNGRTFDIMGRVVACEGENRRVTRREIDGSYTPIAQLIGDKLLNRPHDVVCRSDGSVFFSDPQGYLHPKERELGFGGVHAGPGGCWVFEPSGEHIGTIRLPEIPANCAWGEADHSTMLFTAGGSVYSLRMKIPGCPLPGAPKPS